MLIILVRKTPPKISITIKIGFVMVNNQNITDVSKIEIINAIKVYGIALVKMTTDILVYVERCQKQLYAIPINQMPINQSTLSEIVIPSIVINILHV